MTRKEKRDAKNARHKRNEQRRRKRWLDRAFQRMIHNTEQAFKAAIPKYLESIGPVYVPDRDKQA